MKFFARFTSWGERLLSGNARRKLPARKAWNVRWPSLFVERLEARELLATPPKVLVVTPPDGTVTTNGSPIMTVQFNEDVTGADVPGNYELVDSNGTSYPVTPTYSSATDTATITLNPGSTTLLPNSYTLLIRGDQIRDKASSLLLAQPGQMVVANAGVGSVSIVNAPSSGRLNADQNYPAPAVAGSVPISVATADFNGDGTPDLAVLDNGNNAVEIYQGLGSGLFESTPTFTLSLPANAVPTAMAVADFNGSGRPDIVVTDSALNQVTVFNNTRQLNGVPAYQFTTTNYAAGPNPSAVVVADFNLDNLPDIAVADSGLSGNNYVVSILNNLGGQTQAVFSVPVTVAVGSNAPSGVNQPTGIAAGDLSGNLKNDLAITGTNNFISVLSNQTTVPGSAPIFNLSSVASGIATTSPQIAPIHITSVNDIVAQTVNGPIVFMNLGGAKFAPATPPLLRSTVPPQNLFSNPGNLVARDLNGDKLADLVVANNNSPGAAVVMQNASYSGSIFSASNTSPIVITTTAPHNLQTGDYVLITGVGGDTNANGTWTVTVLDPVRFVLQGSMGNGNYTAGGTFYHVVFNAPTGTAAQGKITAASNTNPILITTAAPHGLSTGDSVMIQGVSGNTAANGTFTVTVISPNQFSLNGRAGNGTYTGGGTFIRNSPATNVPVDANPTFVALGDTNGDNVLDVLTANKTSGTVSVAQGAGGGSFQTSTDISLNLPFAPTAGVVATAAGDLNGDGIPDFVVVDKNASTVSVFSGVGDGTYTGPVTYSTILGGKGNQPVSVLLVNLGGPGLDLVTVSRLDNVVSILANDGTGNFKSAGTVAVGSGPTQVLAADLNGDGRNDLLVSHDGTNGAGIQGGVSVLLATGTDTFAPAIEYAPGVKASAIAVGDFNRDGIQDFVVANNTDPGAVLLFQGDGTGTFREIASYRVGPFPTALAVGDLNRDGYLDVVAVSGSNYTTQNISVLLNSFGGGFSPAVYSSLLPGTPLQSVAVTDLGVSAFPDIVVGTNPGSTGYQHDNVFALHSLGDGTFGALEPYAVGSGGQPTAAPSYVGVISDPLIRLTTFTIVGTTINTNLLQNGSFSTRDLTGERGNLDGWQTFNEANSNGRWSPQVGGVSPLSSTSVPRFGSQYNAMLDEANQVPYSAGSANPNANASYAGSHALYQDVFIPSGATNVNFSGTLYFDNSAAASANGGSNGWSNFGNLDFNSDGRGAPNQQVRVDVVDPANNNVLDTGSAVLMNLFTTTGSTPAVGVVQLSANLSAFAGRTIRLRVAEANNQGRLIVGLTNVKLTATYNDQQAPILVNLALENPGFVAAGSTVLTTTDPTLIGQVGDLGSVNAIKYIEFDPSYGPSTRTTFVDATGHFSATLPLPLPGQYNVVVKVVDKAGNVTQGSYVFNYQGQSLYGWSAAGPQQTELGTQPVNYNGVSGRVTSVVVSPTDPSGNTYLIGSANGGIWKTTDGGQSWTPLTDQVYDAGGNPVPVPIGGLVQSRTPSSPNVIYAGLGIADTAPDSRAGSGVLKSTDAGATWTLIGQAALAGARISKMSIDGNTPDIVYAAVASGGVTGPGVYKSTDGGATWNNILLQALQAGRLIANGSTVAASTTLPSVTDLVVDPFDSQTILVGLGNIGLVNVAGNNIAGFWRSTNGGLSWTLVTGGASVGVPNDTLPSGASVGRVTLAEGFGPGLSEPNYYVLIGNPPPASQAVGTVNYGNGIQGGGNAAGLYKTKNLGSDWTKVMLRQNTGGANAHNFTDLNLLGNVASYVGALAVDPSNPNVVYVGGSSVTPGQPASAIVHGTLRIDTGDMRDANYVDPNTGKIPNDGDDIRKAAQAEFQNNLYGPGDPYTGEGVYWVDLEYAPFGSTTAQQLPSSVHTMAFDAQGRLLIGTDSGLFRGTGAGFGYSFGSVGGGILGSVPANLAAIRLTSINGNLQIGDLTSAAVDPTNPSVVYTTAWNTGSAQAVGPLTSATNGLTGPTNNVQTAAYVTTANPLPGSANGTPGTVFRIFAYQSPTGAALQPQISIAGGPFQTQNIVLPSVPNAGLLPVLAVYPYPVLESGQYQYQALLGTDRVYQTRTSGNAWNDITGRALTTGHITALAFAATPVGGTPGFYAGTSLGELYVNLDASTSLWTLRNTGLPKQAITGIAADPVNRLTAYLSVGGTATGAGHVFMTTNGGVTWTNITANLPDVSANAVAYDPDINPTYPQGRLFVGTDSGVYLSSNFGKSWQRLGQGMPNVPVVGLQYNQAAQTLVAATNGRGAFTLSTDLTGPRVIHVTQPVVAGPGLHSVTFTFNKPINPGTFIPANVTFIGPDGLVTIASITDVTPALATAHTVFTVTFGSQVDPGTYSLTIGPNITDLIDTSTNLSFVGNAMDQNVNGFKGEVPADTFTTHFSIGVDVNVAALISQVKQTGQFVVSVSNGVNGFNTSVWGTLNYGLTYQFTNTGDFNGDGLADVVTYVKETGQWIVGVSNGSGFSFGQWAVTNPGTKWADVQVGDFNGDGKIDVVGRDLTTGVWYVGLSNGSALTFQPWATFNAGLKFSNIRVGDFTGDGKADMLIYTVETQANGAKYGEWLVAQSTGQNFTTHVWALWNPNLTYTDVQVGDFTGTGQTDFLARTVETAEIYVGLAQGNGSFVTQFWGQLDPTFRYTDLRLGDVNGDGKQDFVVRQVQTGNWIAGQSTGTSFNIAQFTTWNPSIPWTDVFLADLNNDGLADLVGRDPTSGIRYAALSTGGSFVSPASVWEQLNLDLSFVSVLKTDKI